MRLSFTQSVLLTVVLAMTIRLFVLQPFVVDGDSMEPNFHSQEYILIDKLTYRFRPPSRGDVVVFHPPTNPRDNYIKRIIGLPGEEVTIDNGRVFINRQPLDEPYLESQRTRSFNLNHSVKLDRDEFFVLGDNRDHSSDSRDWGVLPRYLIEGRTWFVMFPVRNIRAIAHEMYP